jgi:hypothetical protein
MVCHLECIAPIFTSCQNIEAWQYYGEQFSLTRYFCDDIDGNLDPLECWFSRWGTSDPIYPGTDEKGDGWIADCSSYEIPLGSVHEKQTTGFEIDCIQAADGETCWLDINSYGMCEFDDWRNCPGYQPHQNPNKRVNKTHYSQHSHPKYGDGVIGVPQGSSLVGNSGHLAIKKQSSSKQDVVRLQPKAASDKHTAVKQPSSDATSGTIWGPKVWSAGHTWGNIPIPYLSVNWHLISVGAQAFVTINGNIGGLQLQVEVDGCGKICYIFGCSNYCGGDIPWVDNYLPISIFDRTVSFSNICSNFAQETNLSTSLPSVGVLNNGNYYATKHWFFKGSEVWRYDPVTRQVDPGYPMEYGSASQLFVGVPHNVDAVVTDHRNDSVVWFFKKGRVYEYNHIEFKVAHKDGVVLEESKRWKDVPRHFDASLTSQDSREITFFEQNHLYVALNTFPHAHTLEYYPISFGTRGKGSFDGIPHNFDTALSTNEGRATYFFKGKHYWKFDTSTGVLQSADQGTEYGADEGHFRGIPVAPDAAFTTCGSRVGACAFDNQEAEVLPYL